MMGKFVCVCLTIILFADGSSCNGPVDMKPNAIR